MNNLKEFFGPYPLAWLVPTTMKITGAPDPLDYPFLCPELDV